MELNQGLPLTPQYNSAVTVRGVLEGPQCEDDKHKGDWVADVVDNYHEISNDFQIERNMIFVTVFLSVLKEMKIYIIEWNQKTSVLNTKF